MPAALNDYSQVPRIDGPVVYVVIFTNGVVKIGRSEEVRRRLPQIGTVARRLFGPDVRFARIFVSPKLKDRVLAAAVEYRLCGAARRQGQNTPGTQEWFTGIPFDEFVAAVPAAIKDAKHSAKVIRDMQKRYAAMPLRAVRPQIERAEPCPAPTGGNRFSKGLRGVVHAADSLVPR